MEESQSRLRRLVEELRSKSVSWQPDTPASEATTDRASVRSSRTRRSATAAVRANAEEPNAFGALAVFAALLVACGVSADATIRARAWT